MTLFSKIAISLSGGGFRASAFHLGTLAYLNSLQLGDDNLLGKVKVISTNSGGTITGLLFAQHVYTGKTFDVFYDKLFNILKEDKLFDSSFSNIQKTDSWNSKTKRRNLINAFAEYYHHEIFEKAVFEIFLKPSNQLETVIFNATEFNNGLPFRFQNNGNFGNKYYDLPQYIKSQIRLGDILAASSCFPGGFEPLKMPDDFGTTKEDNIHQYWKKQGKNPVAIMDGGIVDNQGINSIVRSEERSKETISTFIISDVQQKSERFEFSEALHISWLNKWSINKMFSTIRWSLIISTLLAISSLVALFLMHGIVPKILSVVILILSNIVFTWSATLSFFLNKKVVPAITVLLDQQIGKKNSGLRHNLNFVMDLPLLQVIDLLNQRKTSFLKIVSDIFMNRISAMQVQEVLFDDLWRGRSLHCKIGFLLEEGKDKPKLSPKLEEVLKTAYSMGTSLWFTDDQMKSQMMEKLIISGQVTLNYTLSEYIDTYRTGNQQQLSVEESKSLGVLYLKLHEEWERFNKDPYWMIDP